MTWVSYKVVKCNISLTSLFPIKPCRGSEAEGPHVSITSTKSRQWPRTIFPFLIMNCLNCQWPISKILTRRYGGKSLLKSWQWFCELLLIVIGSDHEGGYGAGDPIRATLKRPGRVTKQFWAQPEFQRQISAISYPCNKHYNTLVK